MVEIVTIPKLGLSEFGELIAWEVDIGGEVTNDQVLAVIESDKASAEVKAPAGGVLLGTYVEEGEEIEIEPGRPIAVIGEEGESVPSLEEIDVDAVGTGDDGAVAEATAATGSNRNAASDSGGSSGDVKATPRAKRYAQENGVDLVGIEGTGPQGAITEEDVEAAEAKAEDAVESVGETASGLTVTESRSLTGTRRTIANRLSQSAREKPHVMGTREISVERLQEVKEQVNGKIDVDVSLNDLILHFVGRTLEDLPAFNALFEDEKHKLVDEVNVGYAVDSPKGLIVPVIENVSSRDLADLASERRRLVQDALADEHSPVDLQGGTFTVTNVGVFDMDVSYSIINPPQVAILAIGRRKPTPVRRNGEVDFEEAMTFSLTIDHRVLDGADSGAFLEQLAQYIEYPGRAFDAI